MPIKAITFDLDDTFWDATPVIEAAEAAVQRWLTARYPRLAARYGVEELRDLRLQLAQAHPGWAHDITRLRQEALRIAAAGAGYDARTVAAESFEVFIAARNQVNLFEEVVPVLERLRTRYALAVLSNGNADIARVGLGHLFEFALSAVDVGSAKPHPAMFEAACRRLEATPAQVVHVGDHPEHDVQGAAAAGLRTVWINRLQQAWPGGQPADAEVPTLAGLETVLARWAGGE